jgi:hypothetical protein
MMKRQRGRGRNPGQKPQSNNPNRAYESNGPDLKVRGSAQTVFEKYQQLGRDAQSNGDRVLGENYMQHAEHYFRLLRSMQPTFVPRSELMIAGFEDEEFDGDDAASGSDNGEGEASEGQSGNGQPDFAQNRPRNDSFARDNRDRPNRDNRDPREPREPRADGDEDRFGRRRRRRPDRFGEDGAPVQSNGNGNSNGSDGSAADSRFPNRRDQRPDYRPENRPDGRQVNVEARGPAPTAFEQPDFAQPSAFSDPQEISTNSEPPAARERRPRPPRPPRPPRDGAPTAETGFGNELPAFLSAPLPVTSEK